MKIAPFFIRIFRSILKGYPLPFRSEFEEEMDLVFTDRTLDHAKHPWIVFLFLSLREFFDLFFNLIREHWTAYRKELHMSEKIAARSGQRNFIWLGILMYGIFAGMNFLFSEISGTIRLEFSQYSFFTYILMAVSLLVFRGLTVGIFWRTTPRGTKPWGFLPSVLGSTLLTILYALISQFYVNGQFAYIFVRNDNLLVGYGILQVIIQGLVFGGLFGWAYAGTKGIFPFIAVSVIGGLLRYVISTVGIAYTYSAFNMNWRLPFYWNTNIWFTLWWLTLIILSSMLVGALLGWQVNRANRVQDNRSPIPAG